MQVDSGDGPLSNHLLDALHRQHFARIAHHFERVDLAADAMLFEPGSAVRHIYFPAGGSVALMVPVKRDRWVEVGVVGRVGAVGLCVVLGGDTASYRAVVLQAGTAFRMTTDGYRAALEVVPYLTPLLLRFVDSFLLQISQTAACNGHHPFRQRLCRWLMIYRGLLGADEFPFRQALIARVLSVRLATVSEAFASLRGAGLVAFANGRLRILDAAAMEAACCPCFVIIRDRQVLLQEEYRSLASVHQGK